ncbi:MAG TPA: glycosyltransferase [Bacillales bacterium]|nr:glycosyltransferase [Bacillales bacterium]
MKKILFMVTSMNIGGVEKSLLSLLSVIPKEKYDITILLLEKKGGFLEYIPAWVKIEEATWFKGVKPIIMQPPQQTIRNYYQNKQYSKIPSFLGAYFIAKHFNNRYVFYKEVFKNVPANPDQYDIAIAYQGPTDTIDYYIANKVKAKKKISWVHFDVSKHLINDKLYSKLYENIDKVFVVSKEARKRLIEKVPTVEKKTEVFLNIIPNQLINNLAKEKVEFDDDYEGTQIVTVGRLSKEKGQDMAIKVLSRLRNEGYKVRWYCIGEGNNRKEFEILIDRYGLKDEFVLLGAKPNPYPYMAKADVYVQTSRHEGYCLTLAEAKCLAKPIVTTNFIGAYEQIEDGHTGHIVDCNEEEIFIKIKYLLDNKIAQDWLRSNLTKDVFYTKDELHNIFNNIM